MEEEMNWTVSPDDQALITKIANRAWETFDLPRLDTKMDLIATHANGNPLDLAGLLKSPVEHFAHDIFGIGRHLNRDRAELLHGFTPRYSLKVSAG